VYSELLLTTYFHNCKCLKTIRFDKKYLKTSTYLAHMHAVLLQHHYVAYVHKNLSIYSVFKDNAWQWSIRSFWNTRWIKSVFCVCSICLRKLFINLNKWKIMSNITFRRQEFVLKSMFILFFTNINYEKSSVVFNLLGDTCNNFRFQIIKGSQCRMLWKVYASDEAL